MNNPSGLTPKQLREKANGPRHFGANASPEELEYAQPGDTWGPLIAQGHAGYILDRDLNWILRKPANAMATKGFSQRVTSGHMGPLDRRVSTKTTNPMQASGQNTKSNAI